jgi:hypothetical protein
MAERLLDRQISLLNYLTSGAAIFGDKRRAALDPALQGLDVGLLRLEARFSYEKRMEKIVAVFPNTFELLGADQAAIVREFVRTCPPVDIGHLINARQFHDFLSARWRRRRPKPPHLPDVATCELACATVGAAIEADVPDTTNGGKRVPKGAIRRRRGVVLLRCRHDVRPIFEGGSARAVAEKRDTPLAVAMPPGAAGRPQVFELPAAIFDLIAALDDWSDPTALRVTPGLAERVVDLLDELARHGLIEVRS